MILRVSWRLELFDVQTDPLSGDTSFVLGTGDAKLPSIDLEQSGNSGQAVLRFFVAFVQRKVQVRWMIGPLSGDAA